MYKKTLKVSAFCRKVWLLWVVMAGSVSVSHAQVPALGGLLASPVETVTEIGASLLSPLAGGGDLGGEALGLSDLPLLDGRGLPVVGGLEGGLMIVKGLGKVVLGNPNLTGEQPLSNIAETQIVDMLLNGGPTLNFLALDAVLPGL